MRVALACKSNVLIKLRAKYVFSHVNKLMFAFGPSKKKSLFSVSNFKKCIIFCFCDLFLNSKNIF